MAGQQQQIVDTIFNMKRRLLRKDDSSDSEESDTHNHRLHSLKRKAQYTRSGKPESSSDPPPYKKRIEHAGYQRYIIQRNPRRFDPDGDIVEPGDEYEDDDELSAVEENPYADIKLEETLAPLTSAADLPNHPSASRPYTSEHLTKMTSEAGVISRKEETSLWRTKNLLTKFQGDLSYVPSSLDDLQSLFHLQDPWTNGSNGSKPRTQDGDAMQANGLVQETSGSNDVTMGEADQVDDTQPKPVQSNGFAKSTDPAATQNGHSEPATNGDSYKDTTDAPQENGDRPPAPTVEDASDTSSQHTAHRMTTRARAQVASDPSPPSSPSSTVNPIHPLFSFSIDSLPDRDFGLPTLEADDTRMLLLSFVQRQEEIVRTANNLYTGMLQGERLRQDVLKWSKAEAHVGEMSDGEDWYDREEWQLETDLAKGRDEEEDEMTTGPGKKSTRQRRTKDKEDRMTGDVANSHVQVTQMRSPVRRPKYMGTIRRRPISNMEPFEEAEVEIPKKRARGRPRKYMQTTIRPQIFEDDPLLEQMLLEQMLLEQIEVPKKRGPGRPRKVQEKPEGAETVQPAKKPRPTRPPPPEHLLPDWLKNILNQ